MACTAQQVKTASAQAQSVDAAVAIRSLVRAAISTVAHTRGLLPPSEFDDFGSNHATTHRNNNNNNNNTSDAKQTQARASIVPRLIPQSPKGKRLDEWVEHGIWDALQRKYLRRIAFQILDASSGELLEEYVFSVLMQQASIVLDGGGRGGGGGGGGAKEKQQHNQGRNAVTNVAPTKEMVKKQASHLIRVLCQLVATLEPLPTKEDGITVDFNLQLGYSNETPDDYEPPFFRHVHVRDLPLFPVEPLDARVGKMSTGDMHVGCKLRSILADVIIEQRRQQQQQQQQQLTTAHAFPLAALPGGARNDTSSPKATTGQRINMASTAHAAMRGLTRTESEASEGDTEDQFRGQHHVAHAAPRQESCEGKRRTSMELDGATHTWLNIAPAMADESQASDVGGAYTRRKRRKVTSASQSSFDASSFAGYLTHA